MESKLLEIEELLSKAPFSVAPERTKELSEWQDNHFLSLTIDLTNTRAIPMSVDIETKKITATIQFLEFLWATVHLHYRFFKEYDHFLSSGVGAFTMTPIVKISHSKNLQ